MKRNEKVNIVKDLLEKGNGRFTAESLKTAAGTDRRARSALFLARQDNIKLTPVRDSSRKVVAYLLDTGDAAKPDGGDGKAPVATTKPVGGDSPSASKPIGGDNPAVKSTTTLPTVSKQKKVA